MNVFRFIGSYFGTAYQELRKVVWPSRAEVIRHTFIIVVSVSVTVVSLGLVDYGLTTLLRRIIISE